MMDLLIDERLFRQTSKTSRMNIERALQSEFAEIVMASIFV